MAAAALMGAVIEVDGVVEVAHMGTVGMAAAVGTEAVGVGAGAGAFLGTTTLTGGTGYRTTMPMMFTTNGIRMRRSTKRFNRLPASRSR